MIPIPGLGVGGPAPPTRQTNRAPSRAAVFTQFVEARLLQHSPSLPEGREGICGLTPGYPRSVNSVALLGGALLGIEDSSPPYKVGDTNPQLRAAS
jgi:hypothetical protein